ncbi:hypothetical protein KBD75_01270 [Candidatus Woesebacteria bacterium]|nr:hypothetical protein [Candidatus Woesebacteria bacterium]
MSEELIPVEFHPSDVIIPALITLGLIIGVGAIAEHASAAKELVDVATQSTHLAELRSLLAPGMADCHVTFGGILHHLGALIQSGDSSVFHAVGPHLTGAADTLCLVQSGPDVSHLVISQSDLPSVINQITNQGAACLH